MQSGSFSETGTAMKRACSVAAALYSLELNKSVEFYSKLIVRLPPTGTRRLFVRSFQARRRRPLSFLLTMECKRNLLWQGDGGRGRRGRVKNGSESRASGMSKNWKKREDQIIKKKYFVYWRRINRPNGRTRPQRCKYDLSACRWWSSLFPVPFCSM